MRELNLTPAPVHFFVVRLLGFVRRSVDIGVTDQLGSS
jgi:hypothetical protein